MARSIKLIKTDGSLRVLVVLEERIREFDSFSEGR